MLYPKESDHAIKWGEEMEDTNRRDWVRVAATFRVTYSSLDQLVVGYSQNLSKGGVFIKTNRLLPLNSVVRLTIVLPDGTSEIECTARVVHIRGKNEASETRPSGIAVRFLDMSHENMALVESFIAESSQEFIPPQEPEPIRKKLDVLVVDDDQAYRQLAAQTMAQQGHKVRMAEDGLQGLAACLKNPPDIVISDVQMPRMDGWNFLRTIRSRPSLASTLVIFQTTLGGEQERLKGYQLGVDDYLPKPYKPEELLARLQRLVARSQAKGQTDKALRGDLTQVTLPTVLSMLEFEHKTGVVLVVGESTCRIFVREGRPLAIELDGAAPDASQAELAASVLEWSTGQFEFASQDVSQVDRINTSMQGLIMEAARMTDESNR